MYTFHNGKSSPKIRATSALFKKLPKVNNHPTGENSPNPVTLVPLSLSRVDSQNFKRPTTFACDGPQK
jgi:hypothetical protein